MDHLFLFSLAAGVGLVFLIVLGKFALRWVVRLVLIGIVTLFAVGGIAWWWTSRSVLHDEVKPRSSTSKRTTSERR